MPHKRGNHVSHKIKYSSWESTDGFTYLETGQRKGEYRRGEVTPLL